MSRRSHDPDINHEPALRGTREAGGDQLHDEPALIGLPKPVSEDDHAEHSVHNELAILPRDHDSTQVIDRDWPCPSCDYNLRGRRVGEPCPECGARSLRRPDGLEEDGYASWYAKKIEQTTPRTTFWITLLCIVSGGPWAVLGAIFSGTGGLLGVVVFGPVTEEVMKVAVIATLMEVKPYLVRSELAIRMAAVASGFGFAFIENLLYLNVYIANPSPDIIAWRWIVCTALHVGCTSLATRHLGSPD